MFGLMLAACVATRATGAHDAEQVDTADTPSDTADSADTAASGPTVAFDVTGTTDGLVFSFVHLPFDDAGFTMGPILAERTPALRIELSPDGAPYVQPMADVAGLDGAFFVGGLHEDQGDGAWQPDERWVAASPWMAVYLSGELPYAFEVAGLKLGWNAMLVDGSAVPTLGDPLAIPLTNTFVDTLTLEGTADTALPEGTRLALVPAPVFAGAEAENLFLDVPLEGAWTATVAGVPDPTHTADLDGDGFPEAVETFVAYTDADGGGGLSATDVGLGGVCAAEGAWAGASLGLYFSPATPNILWPVYAAAAGAAVGWNVFSVDPASGSLVFVDPAGLGALVASTSCVLE